MVQAGPRQERKVVTVVFADLVGFTSRAETLDPEDVQAILAPYHRRLREELERRGGTVEKFIGDAVMAVFGAPVAHEDDPERAVRAALAIRDWALEEGGLELRMAVNTGEALVNLGARPEGGEGMAAGDVVNTAARLQAAAPVNGILVGEQTYRATGQAIEYREHEAVEAKGKAEPVPVWEALQARAAFGVDVVQAGAPLVGRRRELDLLADALARARQEPSVQLVTLVGVPGIGKSRLVYELSRLVEALPELIFWRQGRSLPYGEGVTYWALAEMVKAQAGILESDGPAKTEHKLRKATVALLPEEADARWVESQLRPLVGLGGEGDIRGDRRDEGFPAWRRFFEAMAEQRPLVLVFEDLHWADENLLDFVDHLVDWAIDVPLLVVSTARPELLERRPGWGGGKPNALTLSLSPLTDEETARLIGELLERTVLPAETQAALLARAEGNPLYAEQFVRMLSERGAVDEHELPETVQGIIAARLDALGSDEKVLLQDAAVVGKVFWAGAVASISGQERIAVEQSLHSLERKEFVRRERRSAVASELQLAFRHQLVRDVAYGQIPRAARADRHRLAAEWIESLGRHEDHAEMLAHHYQSALEFARAAGQETAELEQPARLALREAGDRALALSAFPAAARFYEAALGLWPEDDTERPALLLRYGKSRFQDVALDEGVLERASDGLLALGDHEGAAEAQAALGFVWWHRGQHEQARAHLERSLELVRPLPTTAAKAHVMSDASRIRVLAGEYEAGIRLGSDALAIADELGLDELRASNLNNMGVAQIELGEVEQGLADLERAVELGAAANSWQYWRAALNRAWMTAMLGDMRRAWDLHLESSGIAERFGLESIIRWERAEHVLHTYWRGFWDECLPVADEFIAEFAESGHYLESSCRFVRGLIRLARGDAEGAVTDVSKAAARARRAADPQQLDRALLVQVRVLGELGRRAEADALISEVLELWRERDIGLAPAAVEAACAAFELGRVEEVREALRRVRKRSAWVEAARTIVAGDLVAGAEQLERIGAVPDEANVRLLAAKALLEQGRRAEADAQLHRALALYRSVGAAAYVRKGEALLAASA